ncbi:MULTISPECIES: alpha/beta fold hydrolase [unclassified Nocardia]|uniref:alpha/beta fold hydrolase n=1 Tax=unclassified Nocardia TaxID=2637762 RepID=UPI001CE4A6AC|nr:MULTISPECIES: alpha/beta fold hydrolase [unclassified Nocardia]
MRIPGYVVTDHTVPVPLDHADPGGPIIDVFVREVVDPVLARESLPWLLYLQGGPGGKSPRPTGKSPDWLARALRTHRVLLLDQRGTGRSTPLSARAAARFGSAEELAEYLRHFRADAIVADAEIVRQRLCGGQPWATLGQSYGGFITLTYLSTAPEALTACYITGGLPGLDATADDVYMRTYPRVREKSVAYYERYPQDVGRMRRIAELLASKPVQLPNGDALTTRRLRTLGMALGMGDGAERVHWVLDEAFDTDGALSDTFLHQVMMLTGFTDNPLFAVLQEACYAQGDTPTGWAAHRAMTRFPEFDEAAEPLLFTGEMFYPWQCEEIAGLRPFGPAMHLLAARTDWPALYDAQRLAANTVPIAAIVYHDDMYVDAELSLRTARQVANLRTWVSNEWEHDGLNASASRVLTRLIDIADGKV